MTVTLTATALLTLWSTPTTAAVVEGQATYYAQYVMEKVVENRGLDLTGYVGPVALNRAADLYRSAWLEHDGAITGPYLVVDCAQLVHFQQRLDRGYVAEVSFKTARDWGMVDVGPAPVRVHLQDPGESHDQTSTKRSRRRPGYQRAHYAR